MPVAAGSRRGIQASLVQRYLGRRGNWPSEQERLAFVEETCEHRKRECLTVLGEWLHDVPDSSLLRGVVEALEGSRPGSIPLDLIAYLASLFSSSSEVGDAVRGEEALATAKQATAYYASHFSYSAPFPQQLLVDLWARCELHPSSVERCRRERTAAFKKIGR